MVDFKRPFVQDACDSVEIAPGTPRFLRDPGSGVLNPRQVVDRGQFDSASALSYLNCRIPSCLQSEFCPYDTGEFRIDLVTDDIPSKVDTRPERRTASHERVKHGIADE